MNNYYEKKKQIPLKDEFEEVTCLHLWKYFRQLLLQINFMVNFWIVEFQIILI